MPLCIVFNLFFVLSSLNVDPRALLQADVVLLLGARLNWILHFGLPPRFDPDVKIIQVYIENNAKNTMLV